MTNVSLSELKRICDEFTKNPAIFRQDLTLLGTNEIAFKEQCLSLDTSVESAMLPEDDYWPVHIKITMTIIFSLLSVIGILGNILVVLVVLRVPGMRTPTNCYLVSLALSDCLFFLATSPTELSYLHVASSTYIFGSVGCSLFTYVPYLAINTSSLSITAFTIERFIGICYPLRARYICTVKRAKVIIVCIWIFSFLYNSPWLYLATLKEIPHGHSCSFKLERENWAYKVLFLTDICMFYLVPMMLNIVIYGKITYTLSNSSMKESSSPTTKKVSKASPPPPIDGHNSYQNGLTHANASSNPRTFFVNGGKRSSTRSKMQVIKMLLIVVIIFAVCWLPYRVMVMYNSFADEQDKLNNDFYIFFAKTMIFINCAINPILYNVMSARFRNAFKRLLSDHRASYSKTSTTQSADLLREMRHSGFKSHTTYTCIGGDRDRSVILSEADTTEIRSMAS